MSSDQALLSVCGMMCIYPLLCFALPAYLLGRYRPKLRSPFVVQRDGESGPMPQYAPKRSQQ